MPEAPSTSYDEVPYNSKPRYATHPDCLATLATLLGMKPAPVDRCRVLELGCATGGNLIPMALTLPDSRFVGIDLSPGQISSGQATVDALGLKNIELEARSILDVDDALGSFDYILCHGVYSWVPPAVQDKILTVCQRNLAPDGVAYVSYNTYPGWHLRGIAREIMGFHVRHFAEPQLRVQQARALLQFLARSVPEPDGLYGRILKEEAELLGRQADWYLFHEHLEDVNQPLYFHQFAERAAAKRLQYLGEAWHHSHLGNLEPEVRTTLQQLATNLIELEQYLDFLRNRTFRRSLLCHDRVVLNRAPSPDLLASFHITALARPVAAQPDLLSTATEEFRTDDGITVSTNIPLVKAALVELFEAWPRSLAFEALWEQVRVRLAQAPASAREAHSRRGLAEALLQFFLSQIVRLHVYPPRLCLAVSERPVASPLARLQAVARGPIACLRHCTVELSELDRAVLRLLDGSRDQAALLEVLTGAAADGALEVRFEDQPLREKGKLREILGEELGPSLRRLAGSCLLVG